MICDAATENVRGLFIPIFKSNFHINDIEIGYMLTISSIGYIISTYFGGSLCNKIGQKKVMLSGLIFTMISLIMLGFTKNYYMLLLGMFIFNVGLATISIAINTIIPLVFLFGQAIIMNLAHFSYGLGSSASQRITGMLLQKGINYRSVYLFGSVLFLALIILFFFLKIPEPKAKGNEKELDRKVIFKDKRLYFFMIALGFYVFCEVGTENWLVNLTEKSYLFSKDKSAVYLSLFFALLTIGRLVGGFAAEKIGYLKSMTFSLLSALILYSAGLILKDKGVIFISISGLFFAITFPTMIICVSKIFKELGTYATGVVVTASSSINMILNMVISVLNEYMKKAFHSEVQGIYTAYYLIPLCLAISFAFTAYLFIKEGKKQNVIGGKYHGKGIC